LHEKQDEKTAQHEERTRRMAEILAREELPPGIPFPCAYLEGRLARHVTIGLSKVSPGIYHALMDLNFRRSGGVFYRPTCGGCQECRMIRVPVAEFRPSRGQRRCAVRNADLDVEFGPPQPTAEKHALYRRYLEARHDDGQMDGSAEEFERFLYDSPLDTLEVTLRVGGRLVGAGIADLEPLALSAVYFYFDPSEVRRSLGVFNVLRLIEECRRRSLPYLYLGYLVPASRKMAYKAGYGPHEVLSSAGAWERGPENPQAGRP
jgi:arginine-tRNA-protein transferase